MTQAYNLSQLANKVNTSGLLDATSGLVNAVPIANGGTGATSLASANIPVTNATNTFTSSQIFNGSTSLFATAMANAAETVQVVAGTANANATLYYNTGAIKYYSTAATANWTQNLAFSSTTTMNSALSVGQAATMAVLAYQGSTPYYMSGSIQVDGSTTNVTTYWQGAYAPNKGYASGLDIYTYTVIKVSATPSYIVLASQTQY